LIREESIGRIKHMSAKAHPIEAWAQTLSPKTGLFDRKTLRSDFRLPGAVFSARARRNACRGGGLDLWEKLSEL